MEKYGNVKDHAAFSVALVVRGSDVIAFDVVMVGEFAVVKNGRIKWTGLTVANATYHCIVMICLLLTGKKSHFAVLFEILDNIRLPLNKLVEKF